MLCDITGPSTGSPGTVNLVSSSVALATAEVSAQLRLVHEYTESYFAVHPYNENTYDRLMGHIMLGEPHLLMFPATKRLCFFPTASVGDMQGTLESENKLLDRSENADYHAHKGVAANQDEVQDFVETGTALQAALALKCSPCRFAAESLPQAIKEVRTTALLLRRGLHWSLSGLLHCSVRD